MAGNYHSPNKLKLYPGPWSQIQHPRLERGNRDPLCHEVQIHRGRRKANETSRYGKTYLNNSLFRIALIRLQQT